MKNFFLGVGIVSVLACTASAQEEDVLRPRGKVTTGSSGTASRTGASGSGTLSWGIEAGLGYNMFSQDISRSQSVSNSPEDVLQTGSGLSPFFGVFLDFPVSTSLGIQVKGLYDMKSWSNSLDAKMDYTAYDDFGNIISNRFGDVRAEYSSSAGYLGLTALLRYNLSPEFLLTAGPSFHFLAGDLSREDKMTVTDEDPTSFITVNYAGVPGEYAEISRTATKQTMMAPIEDQRLEYNAIRIGIELGLGYRIGLGSGMSLVPQFRYNYMLNTLAGDYSNTDYWQPVTTGTPALTLKNPRVHSLQLALALWFNI